MSHRKPRTPRQIKRDTDRVVETVIYLAASSASRLRYVVENCVQENWKARVTERLLELHLDLEADEDRANLSFTLFDSMQAA